MLFPAHTDLGRYPGGSMGEFVPGLRLCFIKIYQTPSANARGEVWKDGIIIIIIIIQIPSK